MVKSGLAVLVGMRSAGSGEGTAGGQGILYIYERQVSAQPHGHGVVFDYYTAPQTQGIGIDGKVAGGTYAARYAQRLCIDGDGHQASRKCGRGGV